MENGIGKWIKTWITETGVEGWLGLVIGVILLIMGMKLWAGVAFGIFVCKNWEWIKNGIKKYLPMNIKEDKEKEEEK